MSSFIIMGSGETAPTLVPVHRQIFAATAESVGGAVAAAFVDTPFGFQVNADELTTRTQTYFADTAGQPVQVASWRRADAPVVQREAALSVVQQANWAFSGPGSPSYALRQWVDTPMPGALADVARRGGTLILGSAAAVTAGSHSIPVYEIYKAGAAPHWLPGIDVLRDLTGLSAVVIPHYDNAEGGTHDTRFCYLGETRLARMERDLPEGVGVLGVDEHTALWFDLTARSARVLGRGTVTVRRRDQSHTFTVGDSILIDDLNHLLRGGVSGRELGGDGSEPTGGASTSGAAVSLAFAGGSGPVRDPVGDSVDVSAGVSGAAGDASGGVGFRSLREFADAAQVSFTVAVERRDAAAAVTVVLDLEQAICDWSADTLVSDDGAAARRVLRSLLVRLGELAGSGVRDPRVQVAPYVEALLEVRAAARVARDYSTSDVVRDRLVAAGVDVQDTPEGVQWSLK